jgi:hypothetical protein
VPAAVALLWLVRIETPLWMGSLVIRCWSGRAVARVTRRRPTLSHPRDQSLRVERREPHHLGGHRSLHLGASGQVAACRPAQLRGVALLREWAIE